MIQDFSFGLFRRLPTDGNLVVSPVSVEAVLRVAQLGAQAATRAELDRLLGAPSEFPPRVFEPSDPVEAGYLNGVFVRAGLPLNDKFRSEAARRYHAECANLDFELPTGASVVNDAVSKATRGRISRVVSPEELRESVVFLVNAVYFKAPWASPFRKDLTRMGEFTLPSGERVLVPLMRQRVSVPMWQDEEVLALELEYGGGEYVFDLLLPGRPDGVSALAQELDQERVRGWLSKLQLQSIILEMPRFRRVPGRGLSLKVALGSLGLVRALTPEADFGGMTTGPAYISDITQSVFFEVDEAGTEAAAATAVPMPRAQPPKEVSVTHPFLFLLRHRATGTILFIGRVVDPTSTD